MADDALSWLRQMLGGGQDTQPTQPGGGIGALFDAISGSPTIQAMRAPNAGAIDLSAATGLPPATESMMGAGRAYDPTRSFAANALDPRSIEQAMNIAMSTGPGAIRAYHGSPYDFSQFDLSKIGTGEGAQAYGHGLYFAEHEPVARGYRDALTKPPSNQPLSDNSGTIPDWIANQIRQYPPGHEYYNSVIDKAKELFKGRIGEQDAQWPSQPWMAENNKVGLQQIVDNLGRLRSGDVTLAPLPKGHMYEVQINAEPEHFLDWDKPLSEQTPAVQRAMQSGLTDLNFTKPDAVVQLSNGRWAPTANGQVVGRQDGWPDKGTAQYVLDATAQEAEKNAKLTAGEIMSRNYGGQNMQAKSEALREAGIPGIRYLDQGSRGAGAGTYNYSVFDDKLIEIMRKFGILPPLAAGAAGAGLLGSGSEPPT